MENKKAYIKPVLESETFVPQSYCKTCESGVTYWFECNAGSKTIGRNKVYEETNGVPGLQTGWGGDHLRTRTYHACGNRHEVKKNETFLDGYVVVERWGEDETLNVLIWTDHGTNTHCTTELDESKWEIAKS